MNPNLDLLKCQIVDLLTLHTQNEIWGFYECLGEFNYLTLAKMLRNYVYIMENNQCKICPSDWHQIQTTIAQLNSLTPQFCTDCTNC
jgi:hypothetical protein